MEQGLEDGDLGLQGGSLLGAEGGTVGGIGGLEGGTVLEGGEADGSAGGHCGGGGVGGWELESSHLGGMTSCSRIASAEERVQHNDNP